LILSKKYLIFWNLPSWLYLFFLVSFHVVIPMKMCSTSFF